MADWLKIKNEYISGGGSYRVLADKYGVSLDAIKRRAATEKWKNDRTKTAPKIHKKTVRKVIERTSDREADRIVRLLSIGDALTEQLAAASGELNSQMVKNVIKTKTVEYGDEKSPGKLTREVTEERTDIVTVEDAPIDRLGLKILTDALKNLLDATKFATANREDLSAVREIMRRLDDESEAGRQ